MEENIRLKQAGSLPMATEAVESETILAVDASGNMNRVPVDAEPIENSNKLIKSGGVARVIQMLRNWITNGFAKIDGWYSTLVSGAAENLVGRGSVPAEYTFRTSGGTADLGTGNAQIHKILGKSLVWNQLIQNGGFTSVSAWSATRCSYAVANNIATISVNSGETDGILYQSVFGLTVGHKYYVACSIKASGADKGRVYTEGAFSVSNTITTSSNWEHFAWIGTANTNSLVLNIRNYDADNPLYAKGAKLIDLTLMFGAGDEPTVAQIEAIYPLDYYDHTATPQIINVTASGIRTTGFNQWDEEWENGVIDYYTGNISVGNSIVSINFIPVLPGETYYFSENVYRVAGYDANKNYVKEQWFNPAEEPNRVKQLRNDVFFIKFYTASTYTTYNNDICINLSWSGYRNGEYEPYEEHILYFNGENGSLASVTGKLNGEGESVTIFTNGMRSCGSTHDEIGGYVNGYLTKGLVRIGNRAYEAGDESDSSVVTDGTTTNYVLDTPLEYTLDEPIPANYYVNDFGTEERLPADTASVVAAPIFYDVQYAMNAVDTLRRLPVNYISKASMDNFTTELASKLGTAMNATIAITPTYDSEHEEYDYEITITPNEP